MRKFLAIPLIALLFLGAGCQLGGPAVTITPVHLTFWRTEDDPTAFTDAIAAYEKAHPNVDINVQTMRPEDYEQKLILALANGNGPDLFSVPNVEVANWIGKVLTMPAATKVPTYVVDAKLRQTATIVTTHAPTIDMMSRMFVPAADYDIILPATTDSSGAQTDSAIFGIPLSVDSLALFANADILKKANIADAPQNWDDLSTVATKLTVFDASKQIVQSGIGLGTAKNVRHLSDILITLMAQEGVTVADSQGSAAFAGDTKSLDAINFYLSFADPNANRYQWNDAQPDSLQAFAAGKTAFYLGFAADRDLIRTAAPSLNFIVAPLPQIDLQNPQTTARYPIEVVSKMTKHPDEAWDFLLSFTQPDIAKTFLTRTKRPAALRSLLSDQLKDPDIKPFAIQTLAARSWYKGANYSRVDGGFSTLISTYPLNAKSDVQGESVSSAESYMNTPQL